MSLQPWLADNWRQFDAALTQQRLHHGLLFVAPAGYGKRALANALAAAALCSQRLPDGHACGRCRACLLFAAGTHPDFVRRLFEGEIPEIKERTIEIKAIAREAGYRAKIAVSSVDMKVDCVGACVGVRGSRIKNIVDELGGERIDIVRWNESLQVMIPNALQPAAIDEVFLYPRMGRAIVLVKEDQLSLAIGRRGKPAADAILGCPHPLGGFFRCEGGAVPELFWPLERRQSRAVPRALQVGRRRRRLGEGHAACREQRGNREQNYTCAHE